jgi:hypothetical protein
VSTELTALWQPATLVLERGGADELAWVELEGECVVWCDAGEQLHRLDPIATLIFRQCDGRTTLARVIEDLAASFGLPPETIEADVVRCAGTLAETGLVHVRAR